MVTSEKLQKTQSCGDVTLSQAPGIQHVSVPKFLQANAATSLTNILRSDLQIQTQPRAPSSCHRSYMYLLFSQDPGHIHTFYVKITLRACDFL